MSGQRTPLVKTFGLIGMFMVLCLAACSGGGGSSGSGNEPQVTPGEPPTAPYLTTKIAEGNGQNTISWDAEYGASSYNLYWSTSTGVNKVNGTKISNVTSPYVHAGLTNGTTYYYVVTAVNSFGESGESNEMQGTPGAPPAAPQNAFALAGDGQVTISWSGSSGALSYKLYWATNTGVTPSTGTAIDVNDVYYVHSGLTNDTTYYYVVTAVSNYGESAPSLETSATPVANIPGATSPVTQAVNAVTDSTAFLLGDFLNPTGYTTSVWFEYGTTTAYTNTTPTTVYVTSGGITEFTEITGLTPNTTYHYRLATQNAGGTFTGNDISFATFVTPSTVVSGGGAKIVIDAGTIYSSGPNDISKVSVNGGSFTQIANGIGTTSSPPPPIAVNGSELFFTDYNDLALKKVSVTGGTVTTLAAGSYGSNYIISIAVDSANVYWLDSTNQSIRKVPRTGGSVTTLATGVSVGLGDQHCVATDGTWVYWIESGSMKKVSVNGGAVTILQSSGGTILEIDATYIYWTDGFSIKKMDKNGGGTTTLRSGYSIVDFAVDASNIYFLEVLSRVDFPTVQRVSISGGVVSGLAAASRNGMYLALDDTYVYWTDDAIKKVAK